jgi:hypothetical protein
MVKRRILQHQAKVIAIARAEDGKVHQLVRLAALAAAAGASLIYFFSFFFSFSFTLGARTDRTLT